MPHPGPPLHPVLAHPGRFALRTLQAFRANQGLLLAGAVAYYSLLSIVPLLILIVIVLSHVTDQASLLATIGHYLSWLLPGQSGAIVEELAKFVTHRDVIGWVLLATMLFFSSLAFSVLESAMSVIFLHRAAVRRRHFMVSALLPYGYILILGIGLLLVWYFSTLSQVNVVYGSLTTAIVVLLSLEVGAALLLLGAQVISEYERIERGAPQRVPTPWRTD